MLRAYKYRLYPNKVQSELIDKHIGCCRFIYNLALETKQMAYLGSKVSLSCIDLVNQIPALKAEYEWLKEVDSQSLQQSIIDMDKAFTKFFKGQSKFPNFKKNKGTQSFRNPHGNKVAVKDNKILLPKFSKAGIKIIIDRPHKGEIKSTTISRTSTGKYFVSVLCDTGKNLPNKKAVKDKTTVGIDLGIKSFIVTSNGIKIDNPKYLKQSIGRLKVLQRRMRNKKKGSNNQKKAYRKINIIHEKITNQRKDFLHKTSTDIIKNHNTICLEDLNILGMVKNHKLAQSISDAGWGEFIRQIKYKAEWSGKNVLQIPTFEPSTKICSECGCAKHDLTLADREWICGFCNTTHDRDVNAAINIKKYCLKNTPKGIRGVPVEMLVLAKSKKQEVNYRKV